MSSYKDKGNLAFQKGDLKAAVQWYTKGIDANEDNLHILYTNRAVVYAKLNEHHKAIQDSLFATQVDPKWVKAYYRGALSAQEIGKPTTALVYIMEALKIEPKNESFLQIKAECISKQSYPKFWELQDKFISGEEYSHSFCKFESLRCRLTPEEYKSLGYTKEHIPLLCRYLRKKRDVHDEIDLQIVLDILHTMPYDSFTTPDCILLLPFFESCPKLFSISGMYALVVYIIEKNAYHYLNTLLDLLSNPKDTLVVSFVFHVFYHTFLAGPAQSFPSGYFYRAYHRTKSELFLATMRKSVELKSDYDMCFENGDLLVDKSLYDKLSKCGSCNLPDLVCKANNFHQIRGKALEAILDFDKISEPLNVIKNSYLAEYEHYYDPKDSILDQQVLARITALDSLKRLDEAMFHIKNMKTVDLRTTAWKSFSSISFPLYNGPTEPFVTLGKSCEHLVIKKLVSPLKSTPILLQHGLITFSGNNMTLGRYNGKTDVNFNPTGSDKYLVRSTSTEVCMYLVNKHFTIRDPVFVDPVMYLDWSKKCGEVVDFGFDQNHLVVLVKRPVPILEVYSRVDNSLLNTIYWRNMSCDDTVLAVSKTSIVVWSNCKKYLLEYLLHNGNQVGFYQIPDNAVMEEKCGHSRIGIQDDYVWILFKDVCCVWIRSTGRRALFLQRNVHGHIFYISDHLILNEKDGTIWIYEINTGKDVLVHDKKFKICGTYSTPHFGAILAIQADKTEISKTIFPFSNDKRKCCCEKCGKQVEKKQLCGDCFSELYCSQDCQIASWEDHKKHCKKIVLSEKV